MNHLVIYMVAGSVPVFVLYLLIQKYRKGDKGKVRPQFNSGARQHGIALDVSHHGSDVVRTNLGLASANLKLGNIKVARKYVEVALAADPNDKDVLRVKNLLDSLDKGEKENRMLSVLSELRLLKPDILKGGPAKALEELSLLLEQLEKSEEGLVPKTSEELAKTTNSFTSLYHNYLDKLYVCAGLMEADGETNGARKLWTDYISYTKGHSEHKERRQRAQQHLARLGGSPGN